MIWRFSEYAPYDPFCQLPGSLVLFLNDFNFLTYVNILSVSTVAILHVFELMLYENVKFRIFVDSNLQNNDIRFNAVIGRKYLFDHDP